MMSSSADQGLPADMVVLGKIVAPYGLNGAVKVHPFADDPQGWAKLPQWWIGREDSDQADWQSTKLVRCKLREGVLVAELACFPDRNASETAKGLLVGVPREVLPPVGDNEYYWADLIGLEVVNTHDQPLGQVSGLIETPGNDVLQVEGTDGKERLIPFVASAVLDVDLQVRRVRVDWEADW